jgi:hypothetical protein
MRIKGDRGWQDGRCWVRSGLGPHCNENPIRVFPSWELRGPSPNFHIHVSVSDLYLLRIGSHHRWAKLLRSLTVNSLSTWTE